MLRNQTTKEANFNHVRQLLPQTPWDQINLPNVDTDWTNFKLLEDKRITVHVKTRRTSGFANPTWVTTEVNRTVCVKRRKEKKLQPNEASSHT